ncbi:MAG: aldehyde dehydrogenase family protein [Clostridiales bacterium]|jgi:acyl-CoA reductase-like NAD-dependent aldehyde dehydrogenase|nr:aldehyde dehydrogenase family protein [Clostridiales bacterium]
MSTIPKHVFKDRYQLYIGGEWRDASDGATFDVITPITGEKIANCAQATNKDVDDAIAVAWDAFAQWKTTSPKERSELLMKIADIVEQNIDALALIETIDNGKPIRETTLVDMPEVVEHFRYYAGALLAEEGAASMLNDSTLSIILREPIGVVGQIVPWNYPLSMASWKLAPALAAGCCVVFKPSSHTSLSILEFARLTQDVLPKGVLNVITGSGSKSGDYMLRADGLKKLSFTGSTEVGRTVAKAAADKIIPVTLELGGKSANIFFDDCNWDIVMDNLLNGILFNQGQVCSAASRIFVQEGIYDRFVEHAVRCFNAVNVGDPLDMDTQMGAMIYESHLQSVLNYVKIGVSEGARLACGGQRVTGGASGCGCFMQPTILADVCNDMRVAREEIFGPVVVIIKFKDEAEAIRLANDNDYGLAGGVFTQDINRAIRVARGVETGRMYVNIFGPVPTGAPFGGYKKSGYGRETHKMAMQDYTQVKNIMISLSTDISGFYNVE